jgi:hypothetical protein
MDTYSDLKCWEILKCENLDCQARSEPDMPCWTIAKEVTAFHNVSNTFTDCIVYLLNKGKYILNSTEIQNILNQRELPEKYGKGHLSCALKSFN